MPIFTQGPDPNPKKPKIKPPPGACDTHIHLFGPAVKYPFAPDSPYTSRDALPETLFALQDKLGLSTAVVVSPGGYGRNYSLLTDVLAKHPDRLRGIALMRDDTPSSEFGRLTKLGVRGMRMMSAKRGQHVPNYSREVAARAHDHGWHVQFYPHGTDIIEFADKLAGGDQDALAIVESVRIALIEAAGSGEILQRALRRLGATMDEGFKNVDSDLNRLLRQELHRRLDLFRVNIAA